MASTGRLVIHWSSIQYSNDSFRHFSICSGYLHEPVYECWHSFYYFIKSVWWRQRGLLLPKARHVLLCYQLFCYQFHNSQKILFLTNHSSILFKDHFTSYQCYNNELYDILDDQILITFSNNTTSGLAQDIFGHSSIITVDNKHELLRH